MIDAIGVLSMNDLGRWEIIREGRIIPAEQLAPSEMRDWQIVHGDVHKNPEISVEMLAFMKLHGAKSVVMSDGLMGCPHQTGIDYEGDWCPNPACAFWHGRDRFTHKLGQ